MSLLTRVLGDPTGADTVHRSGVGDVVVLHTGRRPARGTVAAARRLPADPAHTVVLVDVPRPSWDLLGPALGGDHDGAVRLVPHDGEPLADLGPTAAAALDRAVVVADGPLRADADGGRLVTGPSGRWLRHVPHCVPEPVGRRYPARPWESAATDTPRDLGDGLVVEPLPAGVWLHHDRRDADEHTHRVALRERVVARDDVLTCVLGAPGTPEIPVDVVAWFARRVPVADRGLLRLVASGPVEGGAEHGPRVAVALGEPVSMWSGLPVPDDGSGSLPAVVTHGPPAAAAEPSPPATGLGAGRDVTPRAEGGAAGPTGDVSPVPAAVPEPEPAAGAPELHALPAVAGLPDLPALSSPTAAPVIKAVAAPAPTTTASTTASTTPAAASPAVTATSPPVASSPRPALEDAEPVVGNTPTGPGQETRLHARSAPVAAAAIEVVGRDLAKERAWMRRALGARYDTAAAVVARVLSEQPGLRGGLRAADPDLLADLVALRVHLGDDEDARRTLTAALQHGRPGPHTPFARGVAAGMTRMPAHRGPVGLVVDRAHRHGADVGAVLDAYAAQDAVVEHGLVLAGPAGGAVPGEDEVAVLAVATSARRTRALDPERPDRFGVLPGTRYRVVGVDRGARTVWLREAFAREPAELAGRLDDQARATLEAVEPAPGTAPVRGAAPGLAPVKGGPV